MRTHGTTTRAWWYAGYSAGREAMRYTLRYRDQDAISAARASLLRLSLVASEHSSQVYYAGMLAAVSR